MVCMRLTIADTHLAIYVYDTPPWQGGDPIAIPLCPGARNKSQALVELISLVTCPECTRICAELHLDDDSWTLDDDNAPPADTAGD
jgi:hypothetical protein